MKKLCFVLAVLLLLTGCVSDPTPAVTLQPTVTTAPEETVLPTQTTTPPETTESENNLILETTPDGEIVIPDFDIPEYEGELLVPYDPDREVYFLFQQDIDFYTGAYLSRASGQILTKKPYAIEDIKLLADIESEMTVTVYDESEPVWDSNAGWYTMHDYHYVSIQGGDWKEIAEATELDIWASKGFMQLLGQGAVSQDLYSKYNELADSIHDLSHYNAYTKEFRQYTMPEKQEFYCYTVSVMFKGNYVDQTVDNVSIQLGDKTYPLDVVWRFHSERNDDYGMKHTYQYLTLLNQDMLGNTTQGTPFNGGYLQVDEVMIFRPEKDITITGMRCENIDAKVLGCRVYITSDAGNMDFYWDMQQPLDISKGATVRIDLILHSKEFQSFSYYYSVHTAMDYEVNNKQYSAVKQVSVQGMSPIWDAYLTVFEGIDIGEYYICYYPYFWSGADWLEYIPESWKQ